MCVPRLLDCADGPIRGLRAEHTFYNAAYHPRARLNVQRGPRPPASPRVLQIVIPKIRSRCDQDTRRRLLFFFLLPRSATVYPPSSITCTDIHTHTCTSTTNRYDAVRSRRGSRWTLIQLRSRAILSFRRFRRLARAYSYIYTYSTAHAQVFLPLVDDTTASINHC